jgi:hypothetical protein
VCIQSAESPVPWGDEAMKEPPCPSPSTMTIPLPSESPDAATARIRAEQSDLRNALTTEKVLYTDTGEYSGHYDTLREIEPSLDWDQSITVAVSADKQTVCIEGPDHAGNALAIADIASGENAGTYFGILGCPADFDMNSRDAAMSSSW